MDLETHRTAMDFYASIGDWDRANAHRLVVVFGTRPREFFKERYEKALAAAVIADETYENELVTA